MHIEVACIEVVIGDGEEGIKGLLLREERQIKRDHRWKTEILAIKGFFFFFFCEKFITILHPSMHDLETIESCISIFQMFDKKNADRSKPE